MAERAHGDHPEPEVPTGHHIPEPAAEDDPRDVSHERFSIRADLERQYAEFQDGPTMAEILADLDQFRSGGVQRALIAVTIREDREGNES